MKNPEVQHCWLGICLAIAILQIPVSTALNLVTSNQCFGISRGKQFTLGFTDNFDSSINTRRLFILVVAFSDQQTAVTISSMYRVDGRPFQETYVIEAREFIRTNVPVELTMTGTERSMKGIDVSASSEVSVYGLMHQDYTTDGFLGIPTNHLGTQYVVVTFPSSSQFAVIGTQDSTTVHVTLTDTVNFEGQTYNPGDVMSLMVNKLEAVHVQGSNDLTGSLIQSDKPVAVFSGNECVNTSGSACDTLIEQLIPVRSWGQKHVYTASQSYDDNIYRIVAYFSNTTITIPGFSDQTLNTGEFWEGRLSGSGLVSSSKPTLMLQELASINGITVDPSLTQVPSEEQFAYEFGFTTPPFSGGDSIGYFNFISIIVQQDARQTVYLNGSPINSTDIVSENEVPNTHYISITVQLPKGEGVYYVEQTNLLSLPLSVIVYGYESSESYGYAAGLSLPGNEQLLSLLPYYLRELGGETLTITLPCLETGSINNGSTICKFDTGIGDFLVPGDRIDSYTVGCITPTFYRNGQTSVYISLDGGITFPFSGIVYVASQEDLQPLITVHQINSEERGGFIDLTLEDPIMISWDPVDIGEDNSLVNVIIQDSDNNGDDFPVLMEGRTLIKNALNNGQLSITPDQLKQLLEENASGVSMTAFYITKSDIRNKRSLTSALRRAYSGVKNIIKLVADVPCTSFNKELSNVPTDLPSCPCTSTQASTDSNFLNSNFINSFFHPGAEDCFRSTTSSPSGSGQQCCYGKDENIIVGSPGGGTADRYSPGDHFWRHQSSDVLPWLGCCKLSNNCDEYYEHRPSDDCSNYEPPRPARGTGDPHLASLDGINFTFNGAGEFLLVSSELYNLTFQARMEVYRDTKATVYTAFVLQTNDSAKVQIEISNMNLTMIFVDDESLHPATIPIRTHHLNGLGISWTQDLSEIRVVFSAGFVVIVYVKPDVMSFIAQLDTKFQGEVKGLLGNFNGDPDDDLQFPNGTIMKTNSSLQELHEYGLAWLVAREDSIFTYFSPYDYNTYYHPEFVPIFDVPDPDKVSQDIKNLCGDSIECIFDAVTTGSLSFANETLVVAETFDVIKKSAVKIVSCGFPGTVDNGETFGSVYLVNSTLEVTCNEGFVLEGSPILTCQADGQWSSELPYCVIVPSSSGLSSLEIAFIAIGAVAFLVIVVGVIFCTIKTKKAKHRKVDAK